MLVVMIILTVVLSVLCAIRNCKAFINFFRNIIGKDNMD